MSTEPSTFHDAESLATAYHEAGHAIMALHHDRPVHRVNILPQGERLGVCQFQKGVHRPSDDWLETEMLIALAGVVAEAYHTKRYNWAGATRDLQTLRKLALLRASPRAVERLEKRMFAKTQHILADENLWQAITAVAQALMQTGVLSGRAVRHYYEEAMKS